MTRDQRPDLVLVMTDQQRFDQVGWLDDSPVRTPHLDRLAARGVIFDHSYSASTTCVPARTSLMTGVFDHRIPTTELHAIQPGEFTIARALRDVGYQTALVGKMHFTPMREPHGFDHVEVAEHFSAYPGNPRDWDGYDHYHDFLAAHGLKDWRFEVPGGTASPYPFPIETHPTSYVRDRALRVIAERDPDRPMLLVVSFPHPHPTINPPEPYASQYDPAAIEVDPDGTERNARLPHTFRMALAQEDHPERRVDPAALDHHRRVLAHTYGLITQIDDAVGDVVAALDLDRTVLWFTSDHGDFATNRGLVRKIPWIPFDDLARVPSFVTGGPVAGGRRFDEPVQSFDLATTFLDLGGWLAAHPDLGDRFDGVSQAPVLLDAGASPDPDRVVFSALSSDWPMVRRGPHKYIRSDGWDGEVTFDVVKDPTESLNLAKHPFGVDLTRELEGLIDEARARPAAGLPTAR